MTPFLIVAGLFERLAAFVLMGFCAVTAILFHQFWRHPGFWSGKGEGREHFREFWRTWASSGVFCWSWSAAATPRRAR